MKIGILAYHGACNFGAFLQLLSTIEYIRERGHDPRVINWIPLDQELSYSRKASIEELEVFEKMRDLYYPRTKLCRNSEEIAKVIEEEKIDAVIVGSDAVTQHHPFLERLVFPSKKLVSLKSVTEDRIFPNPFWGEFNKFLSNPVPVCVLSGSSQDSQFYYIIGNTKTEMYKSIKNFKYISVRDEWTQKMILHLSNREVIPPITPDPVFAFNFNARRFIPSKEEIQKKFNLPDKYVLLSFKTEKSVSQEWIDSFISKCVEQGYECFKLPYADTEGFGRYRNVIHLPITPIDWYALIKYSSAYVGNNMHPIVVSLHNAVPFFSFDNYGTYKWRGWRVNEKSSKIYHILDKAGFLSNRVHSRRRCYKQPDVDFVLQKLLNFDCEKAKMFAEYYYLQYRLMMEDIMKIIENEKIRMNE